MKTLFVLRHTHNANLTMALI